MKKRMIAVLLCLCAVVSWLTLQIFAENSGTDIEPTELQIVKQPSNASVPIGQTVNVAVEAAGDGLQYQWYFKNPYDTAFHKSSLTLDTYSWKMTKKDSGRQVYCVITDCYGNSATTDTVTLSAELRIEKQPTDIKAPVGAVVKTAVKASGDGLQYQWYFKNPSDSSFKKSSLTTDTYTWTMTNKDSGRQVYCVVTDRYGNSVKTAVVTLRIYVALRIDKQPTHAGAAAGTTVKTAVKASGESLKYQWYFKNPSDTTFRKSSLTVNTYSWKMTTKDSGRQVYCVITDEQGVKLKTNTVTLKIPTPLKITKHPANAYAKVGALATTSVSATGDGLQYQWYFKERDAAAFAKSSLTGKTYHVTMTAKNAARQVYCVITDMFGNQARSATVTLSTAKAEFDRTLYKVKPGATRTVDLIPDAAGAKDEILWTSSNTSIAKVNAKGVITGVKNGIVTITARGVKTGFMATCQLKVCNVKQVAITFDDGPGKYTAELLDFLKENDIRVTFFLVGNRLSSNASVVKRQVAEGHEIGYHSWKHDIQTGLSNSKIISDYEKSAGILKNIAGAKFTLWRAPGGGISDRVLKQIPLPHIMWSVDTLDWKYRETDRTYRVIKNNAKDGAIILLHDIHKTTVKGAMKALKEMQAGDYEFVTVTELLSRNGKNLKPHATYSRG